MSLHWVPWTGPDGRHGLSTVLPYDLTEGARVEPTMRLFTNDGAGGGGSGGVILDIRTEVHGLWTSETTTHDSVNDALRCLEANWRSAVKRARCAFAAWDACP